MIPRSKVKTIQCSERRGRQTMMMIQVPTANPMVEMAQIERTTFQLQCLLKTGQAVDSLIC
jgi:hypothetical protein